MSTATTETVVPRGTWAADELHSNANFEIEHSGVSVFRGGFKPVDAKLVSSDDGIALEGAVKVDTITIGPPATPDATRATAPLPPSPPPSDTAPPQQTAPSGAPQRRRATRTAGRANRS